MAIDANVAYVELKEDGSGTLHLCDRIQWVRVTVHGIHVWDYVSPFLCVLIVNEIRFDDVILEKTATTDTIARLATNRMSHKNVFIRVSRVLLSVCTVYMVEAQYSAYTATGTVERNARMTCPYTPVSSRAAVR